MRATIHCGGVHALQFLQDMILKYCIIVEIRYFGQLVFSIISNKQVEKGEAMIPLSPLQMR